ncbi:PREDICTED: fibroblast growth factor receptor 1-like [Priapulus caudatus]|uniref:Fibroblast growth factor receptor 1-like n=1 Tax=Priapulus caudatus TaxID=37621 RepID=A0ABM1EKY3_PRICU|nr:PREDICTED: fibroblast growth factor receptor 1-like [Priapulus caudatus]
MRCPEYLASKRIVHRDLAARNVLVCESDVVKISDFGLSRNIYEQNSYTMMSGSKVPVKWMAPEALFDQIYTTQSDVWSFGVLLWEIVTLGAAPYPAVVDTGELLWLLKNGYRMAKPDNCRQKIHDIMLACWHSRSVCRPTFADIKRRLDQIKDYGPYLASNSFENEYYSANVSMLRQTGSDEDEAAGQCKPST